MKPTLFLAFLIGAVLAGSRPEICRAQEPSEAELVKTLQSATASPKDKDKACAKLKRTGTKQSIKALAALLTDPQLSHSARYALESLPYPEAGEALLQALPKTSGMLEVGIINSLGVRGEPSAVPKLGKLLASPDMDVAIASAEALGRIGGPNALGILQKSVSTSAGSLHRAEVDGILIYANRLLSAGKQPDALKIFETLYAHEKSETTRLGAFRGIILASGKDGLAKLTEAIANDDGTRQSAALLLAAQWEGPEATSALALLLPNTTVPVQLALIQCLSQRNDPAAGPALMQVADNTNADVRVAALAALGSLGNDSAVALLAEKAASGTGKERAAARQSLLDLNRGAITQKMLALLKTEPAPVGSELLRALGGRGDQTAVPALLDLAQNGNETERAPAAQALGMLADATQIPKMVQLVADAKTDEFRAAAVDGLNSAFGRLQLSSAKLDVSALVSAAGTGSVDTRLALLPVCSEVAVEPVRSLLRAALTDPEARIRRAAFDALCDTKDAELLPDLLKLACDTKLDSSRLLAVRGCVRLATQEETVKLPKEKQIDTLTAILDTPLNTQEKQAVLSGLGNIGDKKALALAVKLLDDKSVQAEAEQAVVTIATSISKPNPDLAREALKKVASMTANPDTKNSAEAALNKIR